MRIAIFISTLRFGGAEKQAVVDATLLCQAHEVTVIAFEGGELQEQLPNAAVFLLLKKSNYFQTALKLSRLLRQRKIEVVHAHLFAPMVISSIATLFCKTSVVWNFHSHAYEEGRNVRIVHGLVSKLPRVKRILFPASELQRYYQTSKYGFPARKEAVFFNSGQFKERQLLKLPAGPPVVIGYIGRIIPLKRVHLLLELAVRLQKKGSVPFQISIVGDGSELPALRAEAQARGVEQRVKFHGFQSDTEQYYRSFSIFTLPSEEEVLSLSLIDAQLAGLPCVAFEVGGNADVVEHGKSGFVVSEEEAFYASIEKLVENKALRREMGQHAIQQSTDKFSQKAREENLGQLYQSVVSL